MGRCGSCENKEVPLESSDVKYRTFRKQKGESAGAFAEGSMGMRRAWARKHHFRYVQYSHEFGRGILERRRAWERAIAGLTSN
jgi:hypothetical protein